MAAASDTASFFLPGIVHQFGNLLLTVQGHVLRIDPNAVDKVQESVLNTVKRGSDTLMVARALLGEQTGATDSAGDLLAQLVELGRVPARECGLSLELRGKALEPVVWVDAESFLLCCADAIRVWINCVPNGSSGVVTLSMIAASDGGVIVRFCYEPAAGRLPFPMAADEVAGALEAQMAEIGGSAAAMSETIGVALHFAPASMTPS